MTDQLSLFGSEPTTPTKKETQTSTTGSEPLAFRLRPRTLAEIVGQEHLLAPGKALRRSLESGQISSLIFWGPPGTGKTTLAEVIAHHTALRFVRVSAVSAGVADLRKMVEEAKQTRRAGKGTLVFIDEIHRFNKAQQDALLPHVENGIVTLIGATTENPSFEVNSALLSRTRVFVLHHLSEEHILVLLKRALSNKEQGLGNLNIVIDDHVIQQIAIYANGDARTALNVLELAVQASREQSEENTPIVVTLPIIEDIMQHRALLYDKSGDQHFDMISALHKSLRGSDPDAGLYWLVRMLEAGEDPLYIVRRLIRFASEDIGMADPQALLICMAAQQAVHFVGLPEANLALAQAVVHVATAPKSNALYEAYSRVQQDVQQTRNDPVPLHLRNAPTNLMKKLGYAKDYHYAHEHYKDLPVDDPERPPAVQLQDYLPENVKEHHYYQPGHQGKEASIRKWLERRHGED